MGAAFLAHFLMCAFREASDSNSLGRFKIPEARKNQMVGFGIALLFVAGVAEASYAIYAPDAMEDDEFSSEIRMYTISDWNFTKLEIASGSEEIASGSSIPVTADYADSNGARPIGYEFTATHSDNEQACDFTASTIDDDVSIEGGIGEYLISETSSDETVKGGLGWINSSLFDVDSMPFAISEAQILAGLSPGDEGVGQYSFEVGVTANSDGGVFCQNNDDSEIVDWKIELVFLSSFSLSYTTS